MAERLTTCPECGGLGIQTVTIHNPETHDMNADATLKCSCGHTWEGKVTSPHHEEERAAGWIM